MRASSFSPLLDFHALQLELIGDRMMRCTHNRLLNPDGTRQAPLGNAVNLSKLESAHITSMQIASKTHSALDESPDDRPARGDPSERFVRNVRVKTAKPIELPPAMQRKLGVTAFSVVVEQNACAAALPDHFQPDRILQQLETYSHASSSAGLAHALSLSRCLAKCMEGSAGARLYARSMPFPHDFGKEHLGCDASFGFALHSEYSYGVGPAVGIDLPPLHDLSASLQDCQAETSLICRVLAVYRSKTRYGRNTVLGDDSQDMLSLTTRLTETALKVTTQVLAGMTFASAESATNYLSEALLRMLSLVEASGELVAINLYTVGKGLPNCRSEAYWKQGRPDSSVPAGTVARVAHVSPAQEQSPTNGSMRDGHAISRTNRPNAGMNSSADHKFPQAVKASPDTARIMPTKSQPTEALTHGHVHESGELVVSHEVALTLPEPVQRMGFDTYGFTIAWSPQDALSLHSVTVETVQYIIDRELESMSEHGMSAWQQVIGNITQALPHSPQVKDVKVLIRDLKLDKTVGLKHRPYLQAAFLTASNNSDLGQEGTKVVIDLGDILGLPVSSQNDERESWWLGGKLEGFVAQGSTDETDRDLHSALVQGLERIKSIARPIFAEDGSTKDPDLLARTVALALKQADKALISGLAITRVATRIGPGTRNIVHGRATSDMAPEDQATQVHSVTEKTASLPSSQHEKDPLDLQALRVLGLIRDTSGVATWKGSPATGTNAIEYNWLSKSDVLKRKTGMERVKLTVHIPSHELELLLPIESARRIVEEQLDASSHNGWVCFIAATERMKVAMPCAVYFNWAVSLPGSQLLDLAVPVESAGSLKLLNNFSVSFSLDCTKAMNPSGSPQWRTKVTMPNIYGFTFTANEDEPRKAQASFSFLGKISSPDYGLPAESITAAWAPMLKSLQTFSAPFFAGADTDLDMNDMAHTILADLKRHGGFFPSFFEAETASVGVGLSLEGQLAKSWGRATLDLTACNALQGPWGGDDQVRKADIQVGKTLETVSSAAPVEPSVGGVFIALGSNVGDRLEAIEAACRAIDEDGDMRVVQTSSLYETEPMYVEDQGRFLNGACEIDTQLEPIELLDRLQAIENRLGRVKTIDKGPRSIDLDILMYKRQSFHNDRLTIPHVLMTEREFVLRPLMDMIRGRLYPLASRAQEYINRLPISHALMYQQVSLGPGCEPIVPLNHQKRTRVMSILNVTPDSFSDGGVNNGADMETLKATAASHIAAGATIIDIGGQSSRPNAPDITAEEEIARVLPAIEAIKSLPEATGVAISIDTYRAAVAEAAIQAGAHIINDISAGLLDPEMLPTVARLGCTYVVMHMRGTPATMQNEENCSYPDGLIRTIVRELQTRIDAAQKAGVRRWRIVVDPGVGFAKTQEQNVQVLAKVKRLVSSSKLRGYPSLLGSSRKGFIGQITGVKEAKERSWGTAATVTAAVQGGVDIVRVHDVQEMAQVVKMADAMYRA
ncbi:hypothetical protein LTR36_004575 [Oleoguttula mirabilis]|uniref:Folic acid synthesis protein FOL1 n=1 Tax=Oleoguttula mirabilis TaxID=1507867 RepID=A0AAV9JGB0_9PEZI|nr:hypothetical protein LTR36_004575 [Oleoguttula mirabilis]